MENAWKRATDPERHVVSQLDQDRSKERSFEVVVEKSNHTAEQIARGAVLLADVMPHAPRIRLISDPEELQNVCIGIAEGIPHKFFPDTYEEDDVVGKAGLVAALAKREPLGNQ